ncbi:unnamed protein product [Dovyalis caffra]|uniref:Uncharacterized protein n=1 Tax=Dovyalis caffra TaxID=77055 RepID=A0AAV1S2E8_9ROSI|nr:unnamed protein product [Dovyalis caffra]
MAQSTSFSVHFIEFWAAHHPSFASGDAWDQRYSSGKAQGFNANIAIQAPSVINGEIEVYYYSFESLIPAVLRPRNRQLRALNVNAKKET